MEEEKEKESGADVVRSLIEMVNDISSISEYRCTVKKHYCNLARRLKLLIPLFEEIRDTKELVVPEETVEALKSLREALESAKELLRFGCEGSKIYLVLEREKIMNKFHEVTAQLEQALNGISYENLDISDEVKEQVELVLAQFRRAKGRVDAPDVELHEDLLSLYNKSNDAATDPAVLRRLADKLQLMGIVDLTQESLALHEMVDASGGDPGESIEKMSMLLKKIKDFVQTENPDIEASAGEKGNPPSCSGQVSSDKNSKAPVIPVDFRCPISLELMKDPVIVSTGQTYERACIEKWLDAGHGTCPKTQQILANTVLTPNYVLRSLIAQWCEANGIEPPKRPSSTRPSKTTSACSPAERTKIESLLRKLTSGNPEDQRSAAGEIRLLAKRNADNRVAIAEAGAIPLLVGLLSTLDSRTQEHAVTALLNLSICEDNKGSIISSGAVPGIVHVLKKGSMEARENAAATLFSLSVVDENKITIGASGAIPPLVTLLSEGTQRGKKDAATALFNLCIFQGNKGKAVRAGVVPTLMRLLTEPGAGMVDEALAILAILASHAEGKASIGSAEAVPVLVEVIGNGSPRNRENFCSRELTSYEQIFEGAELAKLDKTERRYAWIKRRIRTNEEIWKIFPPSWHVPYRLCIQFCKKTRKQLEEILDNMKEKPDVGTLLMALQRTLEFEDELAEKFGGGTRSREIGNAIEEIGTGQSSSQSISDIRKKYERKLAAHQDSGTEEHDRNKDLSVPGAGFNFRGIISSCFEPHLIIYVELEEKTLMENLEKLVQEETWDIEEGSQNNVLSSSIQLFLIIKRSLKRCSALTKNQTLFNLFKVFQRILKAYATKLFARLPRGGTGIVAAATGMDGQIKTSDRDERVICYIVNSAEYCHKTSGELAESVSKIIDSQLADGVDMSEVQDEFSAVITRALVTLVHGLETKFDAEMAAMTRVLWGTLESVGDQSEYVNGINMILTSSIPVLGSLLSPIYFQFFLDKLASSLGPRFYANIFKCKHISETGAQQMLLDTQAVKTILLEIPALGRQTSGAASYSKFVSREMSKAEALLKVILSPVDSVADTYRALLPEGTPMEFQRILELKGLKKADQQSILDDLNKHGPGITQPSVVPSIVPAAPPAPIAPAILNPASLGLISSREDVLARAAALGRGAATTGFKRFLALTEAAKDRKDGPFRKLFNA